MSKLIKSVFPRHHYNGRHTVSATYGFGSQAFEAMVNGNHESQKI